MQVEFDLTLQMRRFACRQQIDKRKISNFYKTHTLKKRHEWMPRYKLGKIGSLYIVRKKDETDQN